MKISDIDANFRLKTNLNEPGLKFLDAAKPPFTAYGIMLPDENEKYYRRLPKSIAVQANDSVKNLFSNTAGGRIRFKTDSPFVAVRAIYPNICRMNHMAQCGISGFSLYCDEDGKQVFCGSFIPNNRKKYEGILYFPDKKMRSFTLYLPLYNNLTKLHIGLKEDSTVLPGEEYKNSVPAVFYGSSITQGGCASRPGTDYEGFISRELDLDYVNLGFSGGCKGEPVLAEYMSKLPMSVFVLDYDHNAPTSEFLEETHEKFFKIIRKARPELPVILVSRPQMHDAGERIRRFEIIKKTYDNAVKAGDKNVYLIDGSRFFEESGFNDPTVDNCHPTDLGFYMMAKGIAPVIAACLKK